MPRATHDLFGTVQTQGGLLPSDLLARIHARDRDLDGLDPAAYHLVKGERLNEAVNRSWTRLRTAWQDFAEARAALSGDDPGTTPTRERWLLHLFQELGYGRLTTARAPEIDGRSYPISHFRDRVSIHLVGCNVDLDRRTPGVAGAAQASPHSLVQEFLNRSDDHLWGFVSNGLRMRVLRDNVSLTRQAYLELDLEAMMEGEVYADFTLLWLVCHQSRVEAPASALPEECWLERWSQAAQRQGARALDHLRDGVQQAIERLGAGFLAHPANAALRGRLRAGELAAQDYYRQLLRLVYRLIFLFVAEDRDVLFAPGTPAAARDRYLRFYSTTRLRELARARRGTRHPDLYRALRLVMGKLGEDTGCPELGLAPLGSFLWSERAIPELHDADLFNHHLLDAVRALAFTVSERALRAVDYRNLGSEELGSVYESLLELHPELNADAATFALSTVAGHERKTTGSYYTPSGLIQSLLDTALDPVLDEAARQRTAAKAEAALLALKVCDPACGSGHFLIAAAHRIARRLAAARTGEQEPPPEATRAAVRDVIGHCIYGVDVNPMAVELCKVALWMEALEPGRPLSFLDHRILCGNSLLGATPALTAAGIPDDAFKPIEGDDKDTVSALRRQNKEERKGQRDLFVRLVAESGPTYYTLTEQYADLDALPDATYAAVRDKEDRHRRITTSPEYRHARLLADAWCAAFLARKAADAPPAVTQDLFARIQEEPDTIHPAVTREIDRLARDYQLFHWHLAFPDVFRVQSEAAADENEATGWSGGFDVVLGNPPWDQVQLDPQEFFANSAPEIANAQHMTARNRAIAGLEESDPELYKSFLSAKRIVDGVKAFVHRSGAYPLTNFGRLNTAPLFAELNRRILSETGRCGMICPTGIATDSFNQYFFADLVESCALASLYDFENRAAIFPGVHRSYKFCLLTLTGPARPAEEGAELAFFLRQPQQLRDEERRFRLSAEDIELLNPNTRTCPIFRTRRDADLTLSIYRRVPVLVREARDGQLEENPWGFRGLLMFMMNTASNLFRTRDQLEADGWRLHGNVFYAPGHAAGDSADPSERYVPLYEAKMIHHFDHRFGDYADLPPESKSTQLPDVPLERKQDPHYQLLPRYWVPEPEVHARLADRWPHQWLLGWRDICRSTDERTVIASVIPAVGVGNNLPITIVETATSMAPYLAACIGSFVFDFAARFKVGGTHLNFFIAHQLPALPPSTYSDPAPWDQARTLAEWLRPRILELTYTAWDLESFAKDCGYHGPPFSWDEERRHHLRCELDAAFFHLYGLSRDDVAHIMDTFPIVKRHDVKRHGEYRTKSAILEAYDEMAKTMLEATEHEPALFSLAADQPQDQRIAELQQLIAPSAPAARRFRRVQPSPASKYVSTAPLLTLKAAAGGFSDGQDPEFAAWVEVPTSRPLRKGMFVAAVRGRSMEPLIPDGAYVLFQHPVRNIRDGVVLLVQSQSVHDPETGGSYTVKRYRRTRANSASEGTRLEPDNPESDPIIIPADSADDIRPVAEFIEVISTTDPDPL